jgi:dipeptidyl aminopeptidase/acylaminoacyl peptidase
MTLKALLLIVVPALVSAQTDRSSSDLAERVARMARIGSVTSPSFSPDGRWLSVISNVSGVPQLYVVPAEGGWPRMITDATDPVVSGVWSPAPDSNWIALTVAPGGGLNTQVYVVRSDGTGLRRLTDGGQDNNAFNAWSEDGTKIYIDSNRRDPASRDSFVIDVASGKIDLIVKNPGVGAITSVTADGRFGLLSRLQNRGNNNLYLVDLRNARDTLLTPHEGVALYFGEIARDGTAVYIATNDGRDLMAFARLRLDAHGKPGPIEVLRERTQAELDGVRVNDQGTIAALVWNVAGRSELELFDLKTNKPVAAPKLPGEIAGALLFTRDGKRMAISASGAAQPSDVWVAQVGQAFRQITFAQHAGVDLTTFARPELLTFTAHDRLELSGWLYRPRGVTGPAPYVLSFHGGPEGQERPGFRADYQALLSQGIGVIVGAESGATIRRCCRRASACSRRTCADRRASARSSSISTTASCASTASRTSRARWTTW